MQQKLGNVEAIRGTAALIVYLHHFAMIFFPGLFFSAMIDPHRTEYRIETSVFNILVNGNFSVCTFFVLSGYVLSRSYFLSGNIRHVRLAAMKRYLRIMLPGLVSLLVVWVVLSLGSPHLKEAIAVSGAVIQDPFAGRWSLTGVLYQGLFGVLFAGDNRLNPVLWTLQIEIYGSFLVFGLLIAFRRTRYRWLGYALCALVFYDSYYLAFPIGVAAAAARPATRNRPTIAIALSLLGLVFGSYPYYGAEQGIWYWLPTPGHAEPDVFYHTLGGCMLLCSTLTLPAWSGLSGSMFRFLGKISFGLYLLHFTILSTLTCWLVLKFAVLIGYVPATVAAFGLTLPILVIAAYGFARVIDEPSVRLARILARLIVDSDERPRNVPAAEGLQLVREATLGAGREAMRTAEGRI